MTRALSNALLAAKLAESVSAGVPERTARDLWLPQVPGKALAVIGVRRGGKTSYLHRLIAEARASGEPTELHLLVSLEDERLVGMTAEDLGWLLEEHRRTTPAVRELGKRTVYLDEVQLVDGWETLVRRLLDAKDTRIFVSGSSARLLSREVQTSLRGRAMEVLVHPFSFRETLRHTGKEPTQPWAQMVPNERAGIDAALRQYLTIGGFPEAQGLEKRDRTALLRSYIDVAVLRDVIDRHRVSNVEALRRLQRHLLSNPAGAFAVSRFHRDLKSQGLAVGEETLHDQLGFLEDAFLIRVIRMHSTSERQRMRNPRKVYPIDPGLIAVYGEFGKTNYGQRLETVVLLELERRGYTAGWVRVEGSDVEVDFYAEGPDGALLVQVSLDTTEGTTWQREIRSLEAASKAYPHAQALLLTLDPTPPNKPLPTGLEWRSVSQWLLEPT